MIGNQTTSGVDDLVQIGEDMVRVAPSAFSASSVEYSKIIFERIQCSQMIMNQEYLDRISQLFCDINQSLFESNRIIGLGDWFKKFKEVFEQFYQRKDFFEFQD